MKNLCDVWEGDRARAQERQSFWVEEEVEVVVARFVRIGLWFGAVAGLVYGLTMLLNVIEQWTIGQVVGGMSF